MPQARNWLPWWCLARQAQMGQTVGQISKLRAAARGPAQGARRLGGQRAGHDAIDRRCRAELKNTTRH
jgi:hypothetical protein